MTMKLTEMELFGTVLIGKYPKSINSFENIFN